MENTHISAALYCQTHCIEIEFIQHLSDSGLLRVERQNEEKMLLIDELEKADKFRRLYYDLDVNVAGLAVIDHLLEQVQTLQQQVTALRRQMNFYEAAALNS